MDRERAETYLRQLAEAELRRAITPGARDADRPGRLPLVAHALITVGAIDVGTADEIMAEFELAQAARWPAEGGVAAALRRARLTWVRPRRDATGPSAVSRQPPWQVVPVGQVIGIRDKIRGELGLLAYVQTAHGGRFTTAGWMHGPTPDPQWPRPGRPFSRHFTAADDQGAGYILDFSSRLTGSAVITGVLDLSPDPRHAIRWLDLRTAPGAPATRLSLEQRSPSPDITVTKTTVSPGELLADVIAARVLARASDYPQETPGQLAAAKRGLLPHVAAWLGVLVAALQAADAFSPSSPAPGQLAGLCAQLGITDHGIAAPPVADLPERWLSMLTRYHRLTPRPTPAPGSWAATAVQLPELDGARIAVLGLHHDEHRTVLHLHAGGVTMEDDGAYYRAVRPLPTLWVRDSAGRWHATRDYVPRLHGYDGEVTLELSIVPPLEAGTQWIDVVATGQSAQVRARLPVRWSWHP
jgi:hypothetical protein